MKRMELLGRGCLLAEAVSEPPAIPTHPWDHFVSVVLPGHLLSPPSVSKNALCVRPPTPTMDYSGLFCPSCVDANKLSLSEGSVSSPMSTPQPRARCKVINQTNLQISLSVLPRADSSTGCWSLPCCLEPGILASRAPSAVQRARRSPTEEA